MIILTTAIILIAAVHAIPVVVFPINSQLPPVARISTPFLFVFSESTFKSTETNTIVYSIANSPEWLFLDSLARTLYGTPEPVDVGTVTFELTGSDTTGFTNMAVTLIISADPGTALNEPVPPLLVEGGDMSGPTSLAVYPSKQFSLVIDPGMFVYPGEHTLFYATSEDNSPLPPWVGFDSSTLTFSGTTPHLLSVTSTPQAFNFSLIASDISGFRSAAAAFQIIVAPHVLVFDESIQAVSFIPGGYLSIPHFRDSLMMDGERMPESDRISVVLCSPDWLTVDKGTLSLSGTAPESADADVASISVTDIYGDVANITINL